MTLDQAIDIKNSQMWEHIMVELHSRIDSCLRKLKTCTLEEFKELQLLIKGYEGLLSLPQDVIDREG